MRKIYRRSQLKDVLGRQVMGLELCRLGLPYDGALGAFLPRDPDRMDMMFALVEQHPELHITSQMPGSGHMLNRYEDGAAYYLIYRGNADPEIEFNHEFSPADSTAEEKAAWQRFLEDFRNREPSAAETASINWLIHKAEEMKKKAKP